MKAYPKPVEEIVNKMDSAVDEFSKEESIDKDIIIGLLSEYFLSKFIAGDKLVIDTEDLIKILNQSKVESILKSLIDRGFVDTIENENGEPVYWLTDAGKKYHVDTKNKLI